MYFIFFSNTSYPPFKSNNCYSAWRSTPCQANEMLRSYVAGKQGRTNLSRNQFHLTPPKNMQNHGFAI